MIRIKIIMENKTKEKDVDSVAKIVIVDVKNRVLMLTRSSYHKKYAGELDLPGGHLKESESVLKGLKREVREETGLNIKNPTFYKTIKNKHYYYVKYDSQPIKLSKEHTDYKFYSKKSLNPDNKFEKIAIEVLEMIKND